MPPGLDSLRKLGNSFVSDLPGRTGDSFNYTMAAAVLVSSTLFSRFRCSEVQL